jgi:hypothetical protein
MIHSYLITKGGRRWPEQEAATMVSIHHRQVCSVETNSLARFGWQWALRLELDPIAAAEIRSSGFSYLPTYLHVLKETCDKIADHHRPQSTIHRNGPRNGHPYKGKSSYSRGLALTR